jgi:flagellar FliL protein
MQKILVLLNLAVVLIATVVVFYAHNMIKAPETDQAAEATQLKDNALAQSQIHSVPLKKIVVNLESKSTKLRYLDVQMNVVTFNEEEKEIIKAYEYVFKDAVVDIASYLVPEDLDTITGKILFEKRLKDKVNDKIRLINSSINQPVIKQIFFSGFVVQ